MELVSSEYSIFIAICKTHKISSSFYGLSSFEQDLRCFIPMFLFDIVIYVPMVLEYGILVVLIPFLCNYLATYMQYIQLRLRGLRIDRSFLSNKENILKEFKEICEDHQKIIRFVKLMDDTFNIIFFVKFATSSIFHSLLFFIFTYYVSI